MLYNFSYVSNGYRFPRFIVFEYNYEGQSFTVFFLQWVISSNDK